MDRNPGNVRDGGGSCLGGQRDARVHGKEGGTFLLLDLEK